jgi:deoxyadenosine kinase
MTSNSYTSTFGSPNILVGVSGIIGVGKSTLTESLGEIMGWDTVKEPVESNEYLDHFYKDMSKYSFPMQVYLLNHRFRQHQQMVWSNRSMVQDRTIYEDVIFAKMLHDGGLMEDLDFNTYIQLFNNMTNFLHRPDLIIYLDVEPEEALRRVRERSRSCEGKMSLEYLTQLKAGYEEWLRDVEGRIPVLRLDWDTYMDPTKVVSLVNSALATKRKGVTL